VSDSQSREHSRSKSSIPVKINLAEEDMNLGCCTVESLDDAESAWLHGLAAEQGHAGAQHYLGVCYASGKGMEKDAARAVQLYGQVAEQGYARAQYDLGECYKTGCGVAKDQAKAAALYGQAAEQGHADAQFSLGQC
jgi:TPR repeat protein